MRTKARGERMKITGPQGQAIEKPAGESKVGESAKTLAAAPAVLGTAAPAALASSVLEPAKAALQALPEIDQVKVEALREALARGEISFDANRLAKLIQRFHGGGGQGA